MKAEIYGIDKEIRESLKNWRKIVNKYQKPSTPKAVLQLVNTYLPFIGIWILMYFSLSWSYWITLSLALVQGFLLSRIFIIQHDCGHQSFLKSTRWNNIIGLFCSVFSAIPYKYWAKVHSMHHGHAGQLEFRDMGDIHFKTVNEYRNLSPLGKFGYRVFRTPIFLFIFAPLIYMAISNRYPIFNMKGWKKVRRSQVWNNLGILLVYGTLGYLLGWKNFLLIQIPILCLFAIIAFWFFYVQHQHEDAYKQWRSEWDYLVASIKGSTYYKLPRVFQWLSGNIGFHHIHHLSPRIPNYMLEKCARENPILQKYVTTIGIRQGLKTMFNKLWDEESQRMITFREYAQIEKARLKAS